MRDRMEHAVELDVPLRADDRLGPELGGGGARRSLTPPGVPLTAFPQRTYPSIRPAGFACRAANPNPPSAKLPRAGRRPTV